MSAESATLAGRAAAEALQVDACTITRVAGQTTDLQTAAVTPTTVTVYSGKCRIQGHSGHSPSTARPVTVGGAYTFQSPFELQIPMSVVGVQINDVVTVTASVLDPDLPGRKYWVKELAAKTHATSRRFGIELVAG